MKQFTNVEEYLELIAGYRDLASGIRNPMVFSFSPIISLARYDTSVIDSMAQASLSSKALTERQGELAIKIILKYKKQLAQKGIDIAPIEEDPKFRVKPRTMDYRKSLYIKDDKILAKFPYSTQLIESIRAFKKDAQGDCEFQVDEKVWKFGMTEYNLNWTHSIAKLNGFEVDDEITQLIAQMTDVEKVPFKIELYVDGDTLNITNCPAGLREHIETTMGGFGFENLEKLADHAGELGYTIRDSLATALTKEYSTLFVKLAQTREAKFQNVYPDKFKQVIDYALTVGRKPIVVFEPDQSNKLFNMLMECYPGKHIQVLASAKGSMEIDPDADFVHTTKTLRSLEYIPFLVSTAGMIYGSDKQIMFQRAGKVVYLTPEVYRKEQSTDNIEQLDF
jgi:hypothetical protein